MQNVLSKRRESAGIPGIRLNAIWYVEADATYSINKRDGSPPGFVAVRTLSGQGDMTLRSGITFSLLADSLAIFEKKGDHALCCCGNWMAVLLV